MNKCREFAAKNTAKLKVHFKIVYFKSFTPFLPATVFRGPLRVRAFVFVR
jgi:hypothetical protein